MDTEKIFYNAVMLALDGNPSGVRILRKKIERQNGGIFGGWQDAYEKLSNGGIRPPDPEKEWGVLERIGIRIIFSGDTDYPPLLREIHHPPLAIYVLGKLPSETSITIVGTRRATPDGKTMTQTFGRELAQAGFVIVSGLALGIDAAAHKGCLEAGKTIAVLACGLNKIYPSENERLGQEILESGGAIISEYPPGEPPYPNRFLERNRIVSGLSRGVLVIEAPQRSGSLATATFALEQGRDVFVVPGPATHPNFFGSHHLIRQGAMLVTKSADILEEYDMLAQTKMAREAPAATYEEKQVLLALRDALLPLDVDKIIEITKLEPRIANQTLSFLVVKGFIKETEAGYIIE